MPIDSYRFLPRSFRPMYEGKQPRDDESHEVWAPFEPRLADARIALLTSGGLYVADEQEPFDLDRERDEPTWGDPTWRSIAHDTPRDRLGMAHLHVNNDDVLADPNIALPTDRLDELVADGVVGAATEAHASVMGYQGHGEDPLRVWRTETGPEIAEDLRRLQADGLVLAPV